MQYFPELFEAMLKERGVTPEEQESFLNPDYEKLHDPLELPDMEKARDRVIRAIRDNEHIVVFSDYDCDGLPGAVVLSDFFARIGYENISFYIPHRHDEGFGLNRDAIEEINARGAKLIITIDCGIADTEEVVLANENRILARFGLSVLRKSSRPGLSALFKKMNLDQHTVSEDDVTFMITPRINAASRMGVPEDAFKLLRTKDYNEAERLALHLEQINNERKGVVASVVKEAKSRLAGRSEIADVIVIGNPEWRPALLGLVANSLVEEYQRPTFVWGRSGDGTLKGSCRSYNGYDLFALMSATSDVFVEFGGHTGAGGFSVTLESLTTLEERLSKALSSLEAGLPSTDISLLDINLNDIGENLWNMISQFAPFGMGNKKPIFKIPKAEIKSVKKFGKESNHLEVIFNSGDKEVKAISFFSSPDSYSPPLTPGASISLLANLEKSYFRNRPELRLRIVDIQPF